MSAAYLMLRQPRLPHASMLPHCLSGGHKPCLAARSRHLMPTSQWAAKVHRAPRHQNRHRQALSVSANAESPSETAQLMQGMRESITEALQPAKLDIQDINGDGRHVSIDVVSEVFEGESSVKRQRMVYKAIWQELQGAVHAVDAMTTLTPTEAGLKP